MQPVRTSFLPEGAGLTAHQEQNFTIRVSSAERAMLECLYLAPERMDCANYAGDGFSYVIALLSAWIPACIYTGLCLLAWRFYHHRFSKEITENYKRDIITRIFFWGLKVYFFIALIYVASLAVFIAASYVLDDAPFHPGIMGLIGMLILRPLLIPVEPFFY